MQGCAGWGRFRPDRRARARARRRGRAPARASRGPPSRGVTPNAQSEACRAISSRSARGARMGSRCRAPAAPPRAPATPAPPAGGALQVARSRGSPQLVSGSSARGRRGVDAGQRGVERHQLDARRFARLDRRRQPLDALVPEVPEQLGVERADREPAARQPARRRLREVARVRADLLGRPRRVVGRAVDRPRRVAVLGVAARVAVGGRRRIAARGATRGRSARGRSAPAAGRRRCAAAAAGPASREPSTSVRSTQTACTPASSSSGSSHGACPHSGSQKPPSQCPKRSRCEAMPAPTWSRTPAAVASSGSTAWVADEVQLTCGANAPTRSPPRASKRSAARAYRRRRALELARHRGVVGRRDVAPVRLRPDLAQEGEEALGHAAGLELVAQHRGQRERDPPGWASSTSSSGR